MSAITDKILADMGLSKGFDRKREEQMLKDTSDFMGEIIDTKGSADFDMPNPLSDKHLDPRDHHYLSTKCSYPVREGSK